MGVDPYVGCNLSISDNSLCTLQTCCIAQSHFLYIPSYGGNMFFAVFFGIFILPHIALGIYFRTWGFMVGMICGLILECVGYISRVQIHTNPFASNPFLIYLICLTIAPVFITAAIYLCLTRIVVIYGEHLSRFQPRLIAICFMSSDFLSLILQAAGGAIADTANTQSQTRMGANIMVAGLVLQAVSLSLFLAYCGYFAMQCRSGVLNMDQEKLRTRNTILFKAFLASLLFATVCILARSIFRAAELWQGFHGAIWDSETDFMILDGAMIAIATVCLTGLHPGIAFGQQWHAANWSFKTKKVIGGSEPKKQWHAPNWSFRTKKVDGGHELRDSENGLKGGSHV